MFFVLVPDGAGLCLPDATGVSCLWTYKIAETVANWERRYNIGLFGQLTFKLKFSMCVMVFDALSFVPVAGQITLRSVYSVCLIRTVHPLWWGQIRTGQRDSWLLARNKKGVTVESPPGEYLWCLQDQGFKKGVHDFMKNYAKINGKCLNSRRGSSKVRDDLAKP